MAPRVFVAAVLQADMAFDLPAERVTPAHLERLYEQHEQELLGQPAFDSEPVTDAPAPVIMQCR